VKEDVVLAVELRFRSRDARNSAVVIVVPTAPGGIGNGGRRRLK
jgi:hypothetical protein